MSWMVVMGIGAVLGLAALGGIGWSLRKLEPPKKWGVLVASLLVGAGGAFMVINATAIGGAGVEEEVEEMEDFDAPLDDDWGDDEDWGDEEEEAASEGDDDWAAESEEGAEATEEAAEATEEAAE